MNEPTLQIDRSNRYDKVILAFLIIFLGCSSFSIAIEQIGFFTAFLLWIGRMIYTRKNEYPQTQLDYFFFAYIIWATVCATFSYNKPQAFLYLQRRIVVIPIVYTLLGNVRSLKDLQYLFIAFIVSALGVSLWQTKDLLVHLSDYLHFERRLGDFQIYMTAGGIMMVAGLMLLPVLLHEHTPKKIRWIVALSFIPILINVFFTFTRSSWLGFIAGVCVIGVVRTKKIFLALLLVIVVVIMFSSPEVKERIFSIVNPHHTSNESRVNMWYVGWQMFLDHPITGIGDIGVEILWYKYSDFKWHPEGHFHNNLIMWLATLGIVGFSILVGLFVKLWLIVSKIEKNLRPDWFLGSVALGTLAVYLGFHVNGMFEWNFGDAEIIMLIWALTGLALAAQKIGLKASA